jgi:hypothetical protein
MLYRTVRSGGVKSRTMGTVVSVSLPEYTKHRTAIIIALRAVELFHQYCTGTEVAGNRSRFACSVRFDPGYNLNGGGLVTLERVRMRITTALHVLVRDRAL